jgi:hypothetical protein
MVPWVRWHKSDPVGGSEFKAAITQFLLQMPAKTVMLAADAGDQAGKVLPLSVMNRLEVDHALRAGDVSDTQLANVEKHFRVD